jgi:uncharacterized protein
MAAKKQRAIVKAKPVKVNRGAPPVTRTQDSFANFVANVGHGTGNQNDASHYNFHPVSRNRLEMEWAYRGSWIIGRVVDCIAKDMTREGVSINSELDPSDLTKLDKGIARLTCWTQICDVVKWSRLYGGSVGFLMIDGQDPKTPLNINSLGKGQFKGVLAMDRWLLNPSLSELVSEFGPDFGLPKFYQTVPDSMGMPLMTIHHSRIIRLEGVRLPYWQRIGENLWGQSVLERMWDRLLAYDSTTTGAAQLVYKAHLRVLKIPGLREILSSENDAMAGLSQQIAQMRYMQTNEGMSVLDTTDEFEAHAYSFAGLDALLMQFGEQLAGATDTPLVKLFGQSPGGFSTGESDLRSYNDNVKQAQVATLDPGVEKLYKVACLSELGWEPPDEFTIEWRPLQQMTDEEKGNLAKATAEAVGGMYEQQIIKRSTALEELKTSSKITGVFANISDEEIEEAEQDPPPSPEALGLELPEPAPVIGKPGGEAKPAKDPNAYKPDDAKPFKALDSIGDMPRHEGTGQFTHGLGLDPKRYDEKGNKDDEGEWAESPLERVKNKSIREAIQAAHPATCRAYGELGEIEPWKLQGTQKLVNIKKVGEYRRDHGEPITVVKRAGEHGIVDGHHRAVAAHLQGRNVEANIVDMDRAFSEAADHEAANPGLGMLGALHLATELRNRNAPPKKETKDSIFRRLLRRVFLGDDYNPSEPRKPKGTEGGGQWTKGGANPSQQPQWKKISGKFGSNEGGVYEDQAGQKVYVKFPTNMAQGRTEVLAARIADSFGLHTSAPYIAHVEGKEAVVSDWKKLNSPNWPNAIDVLTPTQKKQLAKMYYVAALTKNWDVLGLDSTNIKVDHKGNLVQMDTGGSFEFRAQGKTKPYGEDIESELKNFMNPQFASGKVFSRLMEISGHSFVEAKSELSMMNEPDIDSAFDFSRLANSEQLKQTFKKRFAKLLASSLAVAPPKVTPQVSNPITPTPVPKGPTMSDVPPGVKLTTHQRLRRIMNEAHTVSGPKASQLVASVIKCPPPPITEKNIEAIKSYVADSHELNGALRYNKGVMSKMSSTYGGRAKVLDEMMRSARDYSLPIEVTRGIPLHVVSELKVGDTFIDHGFSSTSFAKSKSNEFGSGAHLEVRLPKGFKFLSVPSFAKAAGVSSALAMSEAEAILPRGTAFKLRKIAVENSTKVYYMDAVSSAIQPPREKWASTKTLKTLAKKQDLPPI